MKPAEGEPLEKAGTDEDWARTECGCGTSGRDCGVARHRPLPEWMPVETIAKKGRCVQLVSPGRQNKVLHENTKNSWWALIIVDHPKAINIVAVFTEDYCSRNIPEVSEGLADLSADYTN